MNDARKFILDWSDGKTLKFGKHENNEPEQLMSCNLNADIQINTMCVATGWGSGGKWNVQLDTSNTGIEWSIITPNEYNYAKNVVGQVGNSKRA